MVSEGYGLAMSELNEAIGEAPPEWNSEQALNTIKNWYEVISHRLNSIEERITCDHEFHDVPYGRISVLRCKFCNHLPDPAGTMKV